MEYLIANGSNVNLRREIDTNLYLAARLGHIEVAKLLLQYGCCVGDVNFCGEGGSTVLIVSVQRQSIDLVKLFLHHGANINQPNSVGITPLNAAVYDNISKWYHFLCSTRQIQIL